MVRERFIALFNDSELRDLCFDLNIDYEILGGDGKADKVRGLIEHCERRNRFVELLETCHRLRPTAFKSLDWVQLLFYPGLKISERAKLVKIIIELSQN